MLNLKPLREFRANNISTTVFHFSPKLNRQVWAESNLEWDLIMLLDHDHHVLDYCEQALKIRYEKSYWTPDFAILYKNGKRQIVEVKSSSVLFGEEMEELFEKYKAAEIWSKENGYEFLVVTDENIRKNSRVQNCRRYSQFKSKKEISKKILPLVKKSLKKQSGQSISDLIKNIHRTTGINENDIVNEINSIVYKGYLDLNFENEINNATSIYNFLLNTNYQTLEIWLTNPLWKRKNRSEQELLVSVDLQSIPKDILEIAQERLRIIQPLLKSSTRESVFVIAEKNSVHYTTIWRWLERYRKNNDIRDLIPKYNAKGVKRKYSIDDEIIQYAINEYLTPERPNVKLVHEKTQLKGKEMGIKTPSYRTLLRILNSLDSKTKTMKRFGSRKSNNDYFVSAGHFPHANSILETVQFDHTPIDVIVVDEDERLPVGRPYLTVAIDVHSRVILGYCITFDKPSRLSIATTLISCVESKEEVLKKVRETFPGLSEEKLEIIENSKWKDIRGLPKTIHVDNGADFTSDDLRLFASSYGIHLHFRPVKGARFGGHVERYLGTLNKRLQSISGTTFSNRIEKHEYKSDEKAIYSIDELEARVITEFVLYHNKYHEGIKLNPINAWEKNVLNSSSFQSINELPEDLDKFFIDVLPSSRRTIQKDGISIFNLKYRSEILKQYASHKDVKTKRKRKFIIRYDPRDIRRIYIYDPFKEGYFRIECIEPFFTRLFNEKAISKWEWDAIRKRKEVQGKEKVDKNASLSILATQIEMDEITSKTTKSVRRRKSKRNKRNQALHEHHDKSMDEDKINPKSVKKKYNKKEIDWSMIEKLPTDNMYRGK